MYLHVPAHSTNRYLSLYSKLFASFVKVIQRLSSLFMTTTLSGQIIATEMSDADL